jgi:hypothetical protein
MSRRAPEAASPQYEPPVLDRRIFLRVSYEVYTRSLVASGFAQRLPTEINESRSAKKAVPCV